VALQAAQLWVGLAVRAVLATPSTTVARAGMVQAPPLEAVEVLLVKMESVAQAQHLAAVRATANIAATAAQAVAPTGQAVLA